MKNIKYTVFAILAASLWGCAHFDELNTNPAQSTDMDPGLMIPTIQMRQTENHQDAARYLAYPGGFMNQWAGDWSLIEYGGTATKDNGYMEQMWMSFYPYIVRDVTDVVYRTTGVEDKVNLNSIARILKVQVFAKLTDYYGDIPYFEASKGYTDDIITPKYDEQSAIYPDLLKELKEAGAALDVNGDPVTNDLYYGGDIAKWKKFANSLRLRLAMRLVKVDPATAKSEAEAAIAAGVFTSNDDICFTQHIAYPYSGEGTGTANGIATRLSSPDRETDNNSFRVTTEIVRQLENTGDPRLLIYGAVYYGPSWQDITAVIKALDQFPTYASMSLGAQLWNWDVWDGQLAIELNGNPVTLGNGEWRLSPSKWVCAGDSPYVHMSYAEVEFLMAEAAFRGWNTGGTAAAHYTKGLEAAVRQWSLWTVAAMGGAAPTINEAALTTFLTNNTLTAGQEMNLINTQLWVLHILDPLETWANWRRTGYPDLTFHNYQTNRSPNASNGLFPRRMEYPIEEQMKNAVNYNEAVTRQGGTDSWINRVCWDKVPAAGALERDDTK